MQAHETDYVSLTSGVIFTAVGAIVLANRTDLLAQGRWLVSALLIVIAVGMLMAVSWPWRRR